jgi:glutamine synthetase
MTTDLAEIARERGIRYFQISYTDLFGVMRAKLVPAQAITEMARDGAAFAGFATWLDMTPANSDLFAVPDPASLIQLPWKPEVGWLAADLWMDGAEVAQGPRNTLRRLDAAARARGWRLRHGVECEFFLLTPDGGAIADPADTQAKPCYDIQALMRRYDVIRAICDAMLSLGWGAYQNDHEDANGQFEMNWRYDDALVTADRHAFFKYMAKTIAEAHGLRATFMPKPFVHLTGNGCHAHVSVWDAEGRVNLFADPAGDMGVSRLGYQFLGGVLEHAAALAAFAAPTVNSYKRLNAPRTASGATWSPNTVTWGGNNRTHMIRIPDGGRFELRLADGAVNPYLYPAAVLAAGLDGLEKGTDPGPRLDIDMYAQADEAPQAKLLPLNLLDSLRALEADETFAAAMGPETVAAFLKLKHAEWRKFKAHLSPWERATTLDC